jgi:orotidine-5'-phosphate decarboxylase
MKLTEKEQQAKPRVCLALDVPTVKEALGLVGELSDYIGMCKIGKELHTVACNEGVPIIKRILYRKGAVFLDLKLHDTPNTVYGAAKASAVPGVSFFNIHVAGGEEMCKKAIEGAYEGAQDRGLERPGVIGVTVLTSLDGDDLKTQNLGVGYDDLVMRRTELAKKWGLDGIVCPAKKAGELERRFGSDFMYVTPGIKWARIQREGQKQLYTPDKAVQDCTSSILVIGGAITEAEDKKATAYEILQAMAQHL